ncbi:MAG TPA: Yip1 family protein [Blastocatellia bacterium]|nr:Yip1 family protein [Blastocatellia bacterium]
MSQIENQTLETTPMYGTPQQQDQPRVEEPARLGPFARLTGTLLSPGETFEDVNRKPTWLAPLLIASVTMLAFSLFFEWKVKPDWNKFFLTMTEKRMGKSISELPPDQQDQVKKQLEFQKKLAVTDLNSPVSLLIATVRSVVFHVVGFLIPAGIFALGFLLMQGKTTFKRILSVVAWSWCATGLVYLIVSVAALMTRNSESMRDINLADPSSIVPTSIGAFLPSGMPAVMHSIAGSFDVFTIWYLILLTIGFAAIAGTKKFKTSKAATLVFGVWGVWVLLKAAFAAMGFGPR